MPRLSRTLIVLLAFGLASPAATAPAQPYGDLALADRLLAEAEALAPQLADRWHFRPMLHARIGLVRVQLELTTPESAETIERARLLARAGLREEALALAERFRAEPSGITPFQLIELALELAHRPGVVDIDLTALFVR